MVPLQSVQTPRGRQSGDCEITLRSEDDRPALVRAASNGTQLGDVRLDVGSLHITLHEAMISSYSRSGDYVHLTINATSQSTD